MIHSMTAFARGERIRAQGRLGLEIRTVNHRYLDASLRLPERLRHCETALRETLRGRIERGKVDLTVHLDRETADSFHARPDPQRLAALVAALEQGRSALGDLAGPVDPLELLRWPGLIREPEADEDALARELDRLAAEVLDQLIAHRAREGERLARGIEARLDAIETIVEEIAAGADDLVQGLRERLRRRARELATELDPERLEQEVALLAQKADVAEELDRLRVHLVEFRDTLAAPGPAGRRLDFLAQELNREANTIASKAAQAGVVLRAVDLKVLIEQIREQIQNIE